MHPKDIKDYNLSELGQYMQEHGFPAYHAQQVFAWLYKKGVCTIQDMSNLPAALRAQLTNDFFVTDIECLEQCTSSDGTRKLLLGLHDGQAIESVIIPAEGRVTGCLSSQVGCAYGCAFCASGAQGFKRNLSCGEIIAELMLMNQECHQGESLAAITHLVFMGTGEPFDNYDAVLKAIRIINSSEAYTIGARRITLSTAGVIPGIQRLQNEQLQVELSVSLHAADNAKRSELMPINRKYPLKELIAVCRQYSRITKRQVTFEYILIKNINSLLQDAVNVSRILEGMECKVNLIPCNHLPELGLEPPGRIDTLIFKDYLIKHGVKVTMRTPRGKDIAAACGQLRLRNNRK
jgi:23S rRNA (adenine2503-C2)-methyltransferase